MKRSLRQSMSGLHTWSGLLLGWLLFAITLSGTATVSRDQARIDELWNPYAEAWFDNGRSDPAVALLEVTVDTVEYWSMDKPAVARAFEVAKGLITKSAPDVGDNKTVSL